MCNKRSNTLASTPKSRSKLKSIFSSPSSATPSSHLTPRTPTGSSGLKPSSSSLSTTSSVISLANLQDSLPDRLNLYSFREIRSATNNFLSKRFSSSSSSSSWRCTIHGKDALVFQREFRGNPKDVRDRLSSICRIHHSSLVRLLGASLGGNSDCIYLVYEYVKGASLADCLRNIRNPNYTPLASWISRMQVAVDVAQGLEYMHHQSGIGNSHHNVHSRIKSSSVIITDSSLKAKICHFGTAELTGEIEEEEEEEDQMHSSNGEIQIEMEPKKHVKRSSSRRKKIEGTRGYIAPEILAGSSPSLKTDVFAFGVVLLELMTGEEPIRYKLFQEKMESVSLIDTARDVMGSEEGGEWDEEEQRKRLRRWVDRRMKDSYPVEVAIKVLTVALSCVERESARRPDMEKVAGRLSELLLKSVKWAGKFKTPTEFSVSMAPR